MSMSGTGEPGFIARYPSISSAGVPIKKRRFPVVWPSSPPPQETNDTVENKQPGTSHDSSPLDTGTIVSSPGNLNAASTETSSPGNLNADGTETSSPGNLNAASTVTSSPGNLNSITETSSPGNLNTANTETSSPRNLNSASTETKSPGETDASKNNFLEVKREDAHDSINPGVVSVQENMNLSQTAVQEPNDINFDLGSVDHVDIKEKDLMVKKSAEETIGSQTELHLAPNASAEHVGTGASSKEQVGGDLKLELSTNLGDSLLPLGVKEPLVPALGGQKSEDSHQMPDKLDSPTLSLCLSKEKSLSPCESSDVNSSRSNWDLNTTMDTWEGSVDEAADEAAVPRTFMFDGLTETGDIKPHIGFLGLGDVRGKQILEARDYKYSFSFSPSSSQCHKSDDSLRLSLSPSFSPSSFRREHTGLSIGKDSRNVFSNSTNRPALQIASGNTNLADRTIVKSEPFDGSAKHDHMAPGGSSKGLLDSRSVNVPMSGRSNSATADNLSCMKPKLVAAPVPKRIKSEPVQDDSQGTPRIIEPISQVSVGKYVHSQDNASSIMSKSLPPPTPCPSVRLDTSSDLPTSENASNLELAASLVQKELQNVAQAPPVTCASIDKVTAEEVFDSMHQDDGETLANGCTSDAYTVEAIQYDGPEPSGLKVAEGVRDSRGHCEGSISDEEKVNISTDMRDDDFYGSDYESDGNQSPVAQNVPEQKRQGKYEDEYEDGEVRDPLAHATTDGSVGENIEEETVDFGKCDDVNFNSLGSHHDDNDAMAPTVGKDIEVENCGEMKEIQIKECVDTVVKMKSDQTLEDSCLQESPLTGKVNKDGGDETKPIGFAQPLDKSERNDLKHVCNSEMLSGGAENDGQGSEMTGVQAADENAKENNWTQTNDSTFLKTEGPLSGKGAGKDSNSGGSRSRIITLPRASNATSPYKTRSIPEGSFGRERYPDFDGEKWHPRRNRDELYNDSPRKFQRDRIQGQSFRNSRQSYSSGRGRGYGRSESRGEWDSDRGFVSENYNDPSDFRFPRHKRSSAVGDEELERNSYLMALDGEFMGPGRGGRKHVTDESSFRHPSSRRLSPSLRDGPGTRGMQLLRRIPRNISPSRCTAEDGNELVGPRHGEKHMRGMPDDIRESMFNRQPPPYEGGLDSQFVRSNRNFSSSQRRVGSRVRSKSPIRSRTRSPGAWSSPRRGGSPDGFNGVPDFPQRRSPVVYRMDRMRSPDHPCFPDEMVPRRRGGSPSYMARSNELRDMDSGRVHSHLRSFISNRSPSDRVVTRTNRRFDALDARERTENEEFIGGSGPLRSGRFHEISSDGNDNRRSFGDRRGIVRPFRISAGGADNENFRVHVEDGPTRPFRLCPETDSEFIERGNLRERDFDRRIKDRSLIPTRRIRNMEEHEGAYRQSGQVWQEDGFDESARVKRRRF